MKTSALFLIAACSLFSINLKAQYDDVYYDPDRQTNTTTTQESPAMNYDGSVTDNSSNEDGNTYITNNYYEDNDNFGNYNDYYYTSRLRRFYNPTCMGYNYWDPWYTNYYFYDMNPWGWNSNIFFSNFMFNWNTYNIYNTYYYNTFNYGYGNFGTFSPCFSPYYDPYIWHYQTYHAGYCGWGNNGFGNGFNNGFNNGYNNGYWNGYYDGLNSAYNNGWNTGYGMWGPRREMADNGSNTGRQNTVDAIQNNNNRTIENSGTKPVVTKPDLTVTNDNTSISTKPSLTSIPKEGVIIDRTSGNVINTNPSTTGITTKPGGNITVIERANTQTNTAPTVSGTNNPGTVKPTQSTTAPKQNAWQRWSESNTSDPSTTSNGDRTGQYSSSDPSGNTTITKPNRSVQPNVNAPAPTNNNYNNGNYNKPTKTTVTPTPTYSNSDYTTPTPTSTPTPNTNYTPPKTNNGNASTAPNNNYVAPRTNNSYNPPSTNNNYTAPKTNNAPTYNNAPVSRPTQTNTAPVSRPPQTNTAPGIGGSKMGATVSPKRF